MTLKDNMGKKSKKIEKERINVSNYKVNLNKYKM